MIASASTTSMAARTANHVIGRWLNNEPVAVDTSGAITGSGWRMGSLGLCAAAAACGGPPSSGGALFVIPATPLETPPELHVPLDVPLCADPEDPAATETGCCEPPCPEAGDGDADTSPELPPLVGLGLGPDVVDGVGVDAGGGVYAAGAMLF